MIVEGLARSGLEDARQFAEDIAIRWIKTNYAAFKESGFMHEKYNVESCGKEGGGGEYDPQVRKHVLSLFCIESVIMCVLKTNVVSSCVGEVYAVSMIWRIMCWKLELAFSFNSFSSTTVNLSPPICVAYIRISS